MFDDDSEDDADDGGSHSDKDGSDEAEHDPKINENDDDMVLAPITRAASQSGHPRRLGFPAGKVRIPVAGAHCLDFDVKICVHSWRPKLMVKSMKMMVTCSWSL